MIQSFTIIVAKASEPLRPIHDRMPVILDPSDYDLWLEGGPEADGYSNVSGGTAEHGGDADRERALPSGGG